MPSSQLYREAGRCSRLKLDYQTMSFGKKGKRITITHLRKPIQYGLAGMASSKLFRQNIPLVIDDHADDRIDYDFACLAYSVEVDAVRILMDENIFYGIKRGEAMSRTILFHELGHYYHRHMRSSREEAEAYDAKRMQMVSEGKIIRNELDADAFAAEYLGNALVVQGLTDLKKALIRHIESGFYDEESGQASVRELELRIAVLRRGIAEEGVDGGEKT